MPRRSSEISLNTTFSAQDAAAALTQAAQASEFDRKFRNEFFRAAKFGRFKKITGMKLDMDHSYLGQNGSRVSNEKGDSALFVAKMTLLCNQNSTGVVQKNKLNPRIPKHKAQKAVDYLTQNMTLDEEFADFFNKAKTGNMNGITKWAPIITDLKKQNVKRGEKIILDAIYFATEPLWDLKSDSKSMTGQPQQNSIELKRRVEKSGSGSGEKEKKAAHEESEFARVKNKCMPLVLFMVKQKELNSVVTSPWANCSQFMPRLRTMFPEIFNANQFVNAASCGDLNIVQKLAPSVAINMFTHKVKNKRKNLTSKIRLKLKN